MKERTITAPCGEIKGFEEDNVSFFRGIPYAKTERFCEPEIIERFDGGAFDATVGETDCYQYGAFRDESKEENNFYYKEFKVDDRKFSYAESPMTLNVVAPTGAKDLPVLVFIHGGGHETGTVGELPYGLTTEYARRGVLFVSIGYRLNVLSLYGGNNYGLLDQLAALKWLKRNVGAFGGDGEKITVIGQSAGAMSISDLIYTKETQSLICGAVMMSGGGMIPKLFRPWTKDESKDFWQKVREDAGAKTDEELKTVPIDKLWEAWFKASRAAKSMQAIQPAIDGRVITDVPQNVVKRREETNVPMIFGLTSQDFMPVVLYEMALSWGLMSEKHGKKPVYGYFFDRPLPGNSFKAFHACDLWYMFGNMEKSWRPFEKVDYDLSAEMIDYIANFAKTGDPNGGTLPKWTPISKKSKGFRLFDGKSSGNAMPRTCRRKLLNTMLFDKGPM